MKTKIIIPESIIEKVSNSGKDFLSIAGKDGEWYQVWNESLFRSFVEGKPIKVEIQQIKDFNNVVGIAGQLTTKELKAAEKEEGKEFKEKTREFDERTSERTREFFEEKTKGVIRGACFNKACDITIALYQKREIKSKDIAPNVKKYFEKLLKILVD